MNELMRLEAAGHTMGDLVVDGFGWSCGTIKHGISLRHAKANGNFVVSREDIRKLVVLMEEWEASGEGRQAIGGSSG